MRRDEGGGRELRMTRRSFESKGAGEMLARVDEGQEEKGRTTTRRRERIRE
jgi:hypothetical protein